MKNVAAATRKMIGFYHGNRHDIAHFLKVWAMAKTIGELEGLDGHTQEVLELVEGSGRFSIYQILYWQDSAMAITMR